MAQARSGLNSRRIISIGGKMENHLGDSSGYAINEPAPPGTTTTTATTTTVAGSTSHGFTVLFYFLIFSLFG